MYFNKSGAQNRCTIHRMAVRGGTLNGLLQKPLPEVTVSNTQSNTGPAGRWRKRSESLLPFQRTFVKWINGSPGLFTAWRGSQHLKCSITEIDCSWTSFNSLLFFIMSKVNIGWIPIIWMSHYNKSSIFSFFTYMDAFILIFHAVSMSCIFYTASHKFRR